MRRCEFCDNPVPADATICPVCKEEIAEETLERILPMLKRPESQDIRVMGISERMWGVIRRPSSTYRDIAQKPDYAGPFIILILNAVILAAFFIVVSSKFTVTVVTNVTTGTTADVSVLTTEAGFSFLLTALVSILPNIMIGMIYLVIGGIFAHLAFKICGGTGRKGKTFVIVGYSMIPVILFRIIALVIAMVTFPTFLINSTAAWPSVIQDIYQSGFWMTIDYLTTASFVWVGFLLIFGIREAHDTSTIWATLVAIACMLVLVWTFWQVH